MELNILFWVLIELALILFLLLLLYLVLEKNSKTMIKILENYSKLLIQNEELNNELRGLKHNERIKKENLRNFEQ